MLDVGRSSRELDEVNFDECLFRWLFLDFCDAVKNDMPAV